MTTISASVTRGILETATENRSDPSFSATLADVDEEAEAFTYLEQENPPCFCLARKNNNHASVHYRPRLPPGRYFFA